MSSLKRQVVRAKKILEAIFITVRLSPPVTLTTMLLHLAQLRVLDIGGSPEEMQWFLKLAACSNKDAKTCSEIFFKTTYFY